jgi:tRNA nucleotidyltransferase (CCA-adding enzyme)
MSHLAFIPNSIIAYIGNLFPTSRHERIFLVGGAVRDILLGREHTDIDLVAALSAEEFASCGFRMVAGKTTAPIWFRHDAAFGKIEVTPLADVASLTDDLGRRDFTANAMALTLSGEIIDPLGGRADIVHKLLRSCSARTFLDDPLRIFRALRFEADGWRMTLETADLISRQEWSHDLENIPAERFSREMIKALGSLQPERFFERMRELKAGENFLPELFQMPGIPAGPLIHHPEGDLCTHSVQVLQRVTVMTGDPLTRFCAFFHDIGKLATNPALYPRHHGHDQTGFGMAGAFCHRLRLPAQYGTALAWVCRLHGTFNLWDNLRDSTRIKVAEQAIKAGITDILPLVCAADKAGGSEPDEWRLAVALAGMSARELGINVQQLEGMQPAARPGHILQARVEKLRVTRTSST